MLTIIVGGGVAGLCFLVALNEKARRFIVNWSIWRFGNNKQKRVMESLTGVVMALAGVAVIIFLVVGLLEH